MPEEPFSIVDKVNFINQAGFKRVLIDFSKTKVNRSQIKAISTSMIKAQPLPDVSRFNWKDGFYSPEKIEEFKAANERAALNASQNSGKKSSARNTRPPKRNVKTGHNRKKGR